MAANATLATEFGTVSIAGMDAQRALAVDLGRNGLSIRKSADAQFNYIQGFRFNRNPLRFTLEKYYKAQRKRRREELARELEGEDGRPDDAGASGSGGPVDESASGGSARGGRTTQRGGSGGAGWRG